MQHTTPSPVYPRLTHTNDEQPYVVTLVLNRSEARSLSRALMEGIDWHEAAREANGSVDDWSYLHVTLENLGVR
jgi:hypothetical protein